MTIKSWRWTGPRERAAVLVAEDAMPDHRIADEIGVTKRSIEYWKRMPEFQARVAEHHRRLEDEMLRFAIAQKRRRVERLDRDWRRMQELIDARAEDMADIAGGATGLLVRQLKVIGAGANQQTVEEYAFDRAVLAELRETEKAAAEELGQRVEKRDLTSGGEPLKIQVVYDDDDNLVAAPALRAANDPV